MKAYKEKLMRCIKDYTDLPVSERSASTIKSLIEAYHAIDSLEDTSSDTSVHKLTQKEIDDWNANMKNVDGTVGGHWDVDQTTTVAESIGVYFDDITEQCWNVAMNMMYSDYASVADKYGVSSAKFYGELARAFLWDPDGPGAEEKLAIYAHKIAGVK